VVEGVIHISPLLCYSCPTMMSLLFLHDAVQNEKLHRGRGGGGDLSSRHFEERSECIAASGRERCRQGFAEAGDAPKEFEENRKLGAREG